MDEVSDAGLLALAALAVEHDEALAAEMGEWEQATISNGIT